MHGPTAPHSGPALGRQVSAWAAAAAMTASVVASGPVAVLLLVVAGMAATFTIGRWVEAQRAARAFARVHDIETVLGAALVRCRRWSRPLTLVRVAGPLDDRLRSLVDEAVRTTDEVCHHDDALYVVMPEESIIGATAWARRLGPDAPALSVAQFPVDALTVDGLLDHAASPDAELHWPWGSAGSDIPDRPAADGDVPDLATEHEHLPGSAFDERR